jgi:hypothetical protein
MHSKSVFTKVSYHYFHGCIVIEDTITKPVYYIMPVHNKYLYLMSSALYTNVLTRKAISLDGCMFSNTSKVLNSISCATFRLYQGIHIQYLIFLSTESRIECQSGHYWLYRQYFKCNVGGNRLTNCCDVINVRTLLVSMSLPYMYAQLPRNFHGTFYFMNPI